ncbi:MAG: hypothetical protein AVDCRST_MAG32-2387, partial [uncultured Nocardioides sp.]
DHRADRRSRPRPSQLRPRRSTRPAHRRVPAPGHGCPRHRRGRRSRRAVPRRARRPGRRGAARPLPRARDGVGARRRRRDHPPRVPGRRGAGRPRRRGGVPGGRGRHQHDVRRHVRRVGLAVPAQRPARL